MHEITPRGEQRKEGVSRPHIHANSKETLSRTNYIQPVLPLDKPLCGRLRPTRVRQVNRKPDEFARVLSHSLLFHPPDSILRLFLASRGEVHLCAASHEVECNVETNTRA